MAGEADRATSGAKLIPAPAHAGVDSQAIGDVIADLREHCLVLVGDMRRHRSGRGAANGESGELSPARTVGLVLVIIETRNKVEVAEITDHVKFVKIGRTSCRAKGLQYVEISVVA